MFRRWRALPSLPDLSLTLVPATRLISGPLPKELVALGREVLQISARNGRDSLAAHRHSATDLSTVLGVAGVEIAPRDLVYCALRVQGVRDVRVN